MRLDFGAATDVGLRRRENQDRYLADGTLLAVADGLGGNSGGATAASIAIDVLARRDRLESLDGLLALVGSANTAIFEAARRDPGLRDMSTTLCVLADVAEEDRPSRLGVCNVGDSRAYMLTSQGLSLLTVDHTISENLVRDGLISPSEAATHADRHTLTRSVGFERRVHVDAWEMTAPHGTRLLLCTDGVTNEVTETDICEILGSVGEPGAAASALVQRAVRPGHGRDNATAVVVDVVGGAPDPAQSSARTVTDFRAAVEV